MRWIVPLLLAVAPVQAAGAQSNYPAYSDRLSYVLMTGSGTDSMMNGSTDDLSRAQAYRAGVTVSAGTDNGGPPDYPWPAVHGEIFFLTHQAGMPPLQAIRAATLNGALAMGRARDLGTIQAGKLADFVVLADDPVARIENIQSIAMTVKRGSEYPRADYKPEAK